MLVLGRKEGEAIVLEKDGKILGEVRVCRIDGNRVEIGIEAPAEVHIRRGELEPREAA